MAKDSLENLLLSLFAEDYHTNQGYGYKSQLSILTIKSLIPSMNEIGVKVNYRRFSEELNLWLGYKVGDNSSLLNIYRKDPGIYWGEKDDSIISRIIPIVLTNQDYKIIEEEIIKNVLFTTGNLQELLESLSMAYILYAILGKEKDIMDKLKDYIIGFAQLEFTEMYRDRYMVSINEYPGNYKVDFEKEKIQIISLLNGVNTNRYINLSDCINVLDNLEPKTFIGSILHRFLYASDIGKGIPKFYTSMADYTIRLRKSRVDPKQLEVKEYILPDVFNFEVGDLFFHSLLKESKVIKKEVKDNILTSLIQTRAGMYLFKR